MTRTILWSMRRAHCSMAIDARPPPRRREPLPAHFYSRQHQPHHAGRSSAEHLAKAGAVRRLMAAYKASEELIRIGAYQKGSDPDLDRAIALMPALREFLMQPAQEAARMQDSIARLKTLPV